MSTPEELEKEAKGHSKNLFFGLLGNKTEQAQELYSQAGNRYKQERKWKDAARCYMEAAKLGERNKDHIFAASNLVEASNCFKHSHPTSNEFLDPLMKATQIYSDQGRFSQTGRMFKNLAETYEERLDYVNAMKFYKKSGECYELDEFGKVSSSQAFLKYADLICTQTDSYEEAIEIYEREGKKNLKNDLLKYGAKDLLFKAGLLRILNADATDAVIALAKYCTWDENFLNTREGRFLKGILDAFETNDMGEFHNQLKEFDSISKLDNWRIKVLYKLKEKMEGAVHGVFQNDSEHVDLT